MADLPSMEKIVATDGDGRAAYMLALSSYVRISNLNSGRVAELRRTFGPIADAVRQDDMKPRLPGDRAGLVLNFDSIVNGGARIHSEDELAAIGSAILLRVIDSGFGVGALTGGIAREPDHELLVSAPERQG